MAEQLRRLLILDDSPEDRTVMRLLLEEAPGRSWSFLEEDKCAPALKLLESEEIDCILLDYHLPDMNGLRFLRELTTRFGELRFPVVMFTGSGRAAVAVDALQAGAQEYLSKDIIRIDTLVHAIDNAIERVRLLRERREHLRELEITNRRLLLLEAALEATCESVIITEAELEQPGPRIIFVNQAFTRMTGYQAAEVIGKTPRILQGEKTGRAVLDRLRSDLQAGRAFSGQTINYRKDGSEFVLDWALAPIFDPGGTVTHYVAVQRDVTGQRHEDQQLRRSQERFELAVQGAGLGLWDYDLVQKRFSYDRQCAAMLGYNAAEIEPAGEGWSPLVHPGDLPAAKQIFERHLRGETPAYKAEFRMMTRAGDWRWILARGKVVDWGPDGNPLRASGTHLDVTARRQAEITLRRSHEDLRQFAHTVSHDLQEPLLLMSTYSQFLSRRFARKLKGRGDALLASLQENAQRASQLVADLLEYSRAGSGDQELLETTSLNDVLSAVLLTLETRIQQAGAVIEHGSLPRLRGNPVQLEQLFHNLLANALKYRQPGVPLRIRVGARQEDGFWTISVTDNGIGFPPDKADYIFGLFQRLDSGTRAGSGIGLATCKRIVENHGGRIWAESSPGTGSTIFFRVPVRIHSMAVGASPEQ